MRYFREIMSRSTSFIKEHGLIENEEGIMVGLSGGKDSMTLLMVLKAFLRHSKYKYPLSAGYIDLGLGADYSGLENFCKEMDVPFFVEKPISVRWFSMYERKRIHAPSAPKCAAVPLMILRSETDIRKWHWGIIGKIMWKPF